MAAAPSIVLPSPQSDGTRSVEAVIAARRTRRVFSERSLTLSEAGQLLWAAQGVTGPDGRRTIPSAGGHQLLDAALVAGGVDDLEPGAYAYSPAAHQLMPRRPGDLRKALAAAAIGEQPWLAQAAVVIVLGADVAAINDAFADQPPTGERSFRYACMEVGHGAQNIYLQAESLDLAVVLVAGFDDSAMGSLGLLATGMQPLALIAVGGRSDQL